MAAGGKKACGAIALLVVVPAVFAQPAREGAGDARFDVSGYAIEGRVLLKAEDFTRIVAPFIGRQKSTVDVAQARNTLQQAYHDLGYCSTRVALPQSQSIPQDGVVTFHVTEVAAGGTGNCLPLVALDESSKPVPPVRVAANGGVMTNPYLKVRDSTQSPVILQASTQFSANQPKEKPAFGVTAFPFIESRGNTGLILTMDDAGPVAFVQPLIVAQAQPQAPFQPLLSQPKASAEKRPVQMAQAPVPAEVTQVAPAAAPKFEIQRYQIEGNSLLSQQKLDAVLAPFTGKNKDFGDVQRALEALQGVYQREGYGSVEIRLPEQELERGEVKFVVIEAKIGKVLVEGNEHFSIANIRRSVPALREGVTPNSQDIAQSIRLSNENPAKQATVLLKGTEQEGQIDATIRVADVPPQRYSISLDNTGTESTGHLRTGFAYQHGNLFDRDHVLTVQAITSPTNAHNVGVFGVGYRIPLYSYGDSIDFIAGYSDVNSGVVQDLFNVTGKGSVYAMRYNAGLAKWGDVEHRLTYGLDYRSYQNNVVPVGGIVNLVPDIVVHPFSLTYVASLRQEQRELSGFVSFVQNLPGMNDGTDDIFKLARFPVGTAGYRLFRFGGNYSRSFLGDWQARIRLDAQYSDDALITGEQFAIGGADNVRGFNERYTSNDKGYRTNWEIYTPDWAKHLGMESGRLRFLAFYDTGATYRNREQPGELAATSLDSVGFGIRFSYKSNFTLRLDVAHILHDGTQGPQ